MLNDRTFYINTMNIFCVNGLSKKLQKKSFIILFMGKISPSNAKSYPHIHSLGWLKVNLGPTQLILVFDG